MNKQLSEYESELIDLIRKDPAPIVKAVFNAYYGKSNFDESDTLAKAYSLLVTIQH